MKYTFEEARDKLLSLGFETHWHSGDRTTIGMTYCCDMFGKKVALFDAYVVFNITYYIDRDTFELTYNTKTWTFSLKSGEYSPLDRKDFDLIRNGFFQYCLSLENTPREKIFKK